MDSVFTHPYTDLEWFTNAIAYHRYLKSMNYGIPTHPNYALMVTRHVWYDDNNILTFNQYPQMYRITRMVRNYLRNNA